MLSLGSWVFSLLCSDWFSWQLPWWALNGIIDQSDKCAYEILEVVPTSRV